MVHLVCVELVAAFYEVFYLLDLVVHVLLHFSCLRCYSLSLVLVSYYKRVPNLSLLNLLGNASQVFHSLLQIFFSFTDNQLQILYASSD